jgi:hypothetical protein
MKELTRRQQEIWTSIFRSATACLRPLRNRGFQVHGSGRLDLKALL